jgi:hypothetical protein
MSIIVETRGYGVHFLEALAFGRHPERRAGMSEWGEGSSGKEGRKEVADITARILCSPPSSAKSLALNEFLRTSA